MAKTAKKTEEPEGEQQQTAANFLAAQTKSKKKVPAKSKLAVNVDKSQFEPKENTMAKAAKKTAKPAKAAKVAKAKTARKEGTRSRISGKITVVKKENPFREGTGRFEIMQKLFKCKDVDSARAAGLSGRAVQRAVEAGLIKVTAV